MSYRARQDGKWIRILKVLAITVSGGRDGLLWKSIWWGIRKWKKCLGCYFHCKTKSENIKRKPIFIVLPLDCEQPFNELQTADASSNK